MSSGMYDKIAELVTGGKSKGYIEGSKVDKWEKIREGGGKYQFLGDGREKQLFQSLISTMDDDKGRSEMEEKLRGVGREGEEIYEWLKVLWEIRGIVGGK